MLFFVSVGLMLDWHIFLERPGEVLAVVLIIMGVTTTVSFSLSVLLRWPLDTALTVAASARSANFHTFSRSRASRSGLPTTR